MGSPPRISQSPSLQETSFNKEESFKVIPHQRQSVACSRIALNVFSLANLTGTGVALAFHNSFPSNLKVSILTACYLNIGFTVRVLMEANLPPHLATLIHNTVARWSLEVYEILWQWYLNEPDPTVQEAILNGITAMGSFHTSGDAFKALQLQKADRPHTLADLDLNGSIVNKIIGPSIDNKKGQRLLKTIIAISGIGLVVLGFTGKTGLEALFKSLGYFGIFQGVGFFGMECLFQKLKKIEAEPVYQDLDNLKAPPVSFKTKMLRFAVKVAPFGSELLAFVSLMNRPELYIPAGFLYGMSQNLAQWEFQLLNAEICEERRSRNMSEGKKSLALRVDECASLVFFASFLAWFGFGMSESDEKDEIGIGVLIASTIISFILAKWTDIAFIPEKSGRIVSHLKYLLYHHPFLLTIAYLGFSEISYADDETLELDSTTKYVCGLIALGIFGVIMATNRARSISSSRETPAWASSLYRVLWIQTVLMRLQGKL